MLFGPDSCIMVEGHFLLDLKFKKYVLQFQSSSLASICITISLFFYSVGGKRGTQCESVDLVTSET